MKYITSLFTITLSLGSYPSTSSFSCHPKHSHKRSSLRRSVKDSAQETPTSQKNLLIIGGGLGGVSTAFDARNFLPRENTKITVVSDRSHFSFTPSNPWVAVGTRTPKDIQLDLADILPRYDIEFVNKKAISLDPVNKVMVLADRDKLEYDYLISATGPRLHFDEVPGLREHGESVCTTPHAIEALSALDRLCSDPGPVVVGATQGASCFGPAYEYAFLLQHALKKRGGQALVDKCPIQFVTSEPYVGHLGLNGAGDSRKIMMDLLKQSNINAWTNCQTNRVNKDSVTIQPASLNTGKLEDEVTLPSKLTMMIPPFHGHALWQNVPKMTDELGMVLVNEFQQSLAYPEIFGVGICVHMDPPEKVKETETIPIGVPKTGYMIESMGTAAIKNIRTMMDYAENEPHDSRVVLHSVPQLNGLCLTDFGNTGAVFVTMPQLPPRRFDWTVHGKVGTLAKIAFEKYFLHKIESGDLDPYYEKYMLKLVGIERTEEH